MQTLLQTAIRNLLILAFIVIWSAYGIWDLIVRHLKAYRSTTAPRNRRQFSWRDRLFQSKVHRRPAVLDGDGEWRHGFLQLSKIRMHYVESGDPTRPLMLFVHGFPEFWYSYRFQLRHFAKDYHVVAVDLRGFSESDKPVGIANYRLEVVARDICEAIQQLGGPAILVGHDWGGRVAWTVAMLRPELLVRLVILNVPHPRAYLHVIHTDTHQLWKAWYRFLFQVPLLAEFYLSALDFGFICNLFPKNFTEEDLAAWRYVYSQSGALTAPLNYYRAEMRDVVFGGYEFLWAKASEKIQTKTLIIWGEKDAFLDATGARLSLEMCADARLESLADASHWVQQDAPERVNALIQRFLAEE